MLPFDNYSLARLDLTMWDDHEFTESKITHILNAMWQMRDIVRWLWMHGSIDYSHSRWDATRTKHHEKTIKTLIQHSLTILMGCDKHDTLREYYKCMDLTTTHTLNGCDKLQMSWDSCECMDLMIAYELDGIQQEQDVARQLWMHGFSDHSQARCHARNRIHHECWKLTQ